MAKAVSKKFRQALERIAKTEIKGAKLHRIDAEYDIDSDGDPIVRIAVVVDHADRIKSPTFTSFARAVRHEFIADRNAYPLISFRSMSDDKGTNSEAA